MSKKTESPNHQFKQRIKGRLPESTYLALRAKILEITGYSHNTWSDMIKGVNPNIKFVTELCDAFECSPRQLVDPDYPLSAEAAERYLSAHGVRA